MRFKNVVIESMAYALPEKIWTSTAIEEALAPLYERLNLPLGRLAMMTGIQERRHWDSQFLASEAALQAGRNLLRKTELSLDSVDVLMHAAVCRDRLEPATAAYVHRGLKLAETTQIFDISNACLGVLNAMMVGASMIESGSARSVIIVSGENGMPLLEWTLKKLTEDTSLTRQSIKPFFANLTIGSAAVAIRLCHSNLVRTPKPIFLGGIARTDTSACELCEGSSTGSHSLEMQTHAEALLNAGLKISKGAWESFKQEMAWSDDTAQWIITHQVGRQHQSKLYEALGLDESKDVSTFPYLGNTGSVALPLTFCKASEEKTIAMGNSILLLGIGSGLSTLMLGIQWQS